MCVVIFCGGQGTRLREETEFRPKPLVEIGGQPILWHIMKLYTHYHCCDFVLCLVYRGRMIKEYFLSYDAMNRDFTMRVGNSSGMELADGHDEPGFQVTLADTGQETMTGGRLKRVAKYIRSDPFMVTYGDCLANVDITDLLNFHKSHGRIATVTTVRPQSRFGVVDLHCSGVVQRFAEKPQAEGWVSAGFFVFDRKVLDYIDGDDCVLERGPLERLAADGQLVAYRHDGFFFAMDTYREYLILNDLWSRNEAPWRIWS